MDAQTILILKIIAAVWGGVSLIVFVGSMAHELDTEASDLLPAIWNSLGRAIFWPIVGAIYILAHS